MIDKIKKELESIGYEFVSYKKGTLVYKDYRGANTTITGRSMRECWDKLNDEIYLGM